MKIINRGGVKIINRDGAEVDHAYISRDDIFDNHLLMNAKFTLLY